jgi:23S rRNA (cytosine1962-C5)-methyltransferase
VALVSSIHYPSASLKPHREKNLLAGHLWVFSGSLQQPPYWVESGGLLDVKSSTGQFVGRGYYNPQTDIAIRILTRDAVDIIDEQFIRRRVRHALARRKVFELDDAYTNAYRVVNAEGDMLPGLIVDRYGDVFVIQVHTAGMESLCPLVIAALTQETNAKGILLRNDSQARRREGLPLEAPRVVFGEVPNLVQVIENGIQILVDVWYGQKTGLFLDQRDKRKALKQYTKGQRVLNCFSYTGGFSLNAALSKVPARVTSVDISEAAIEAARQNFELNGIDTAQHEFIVADAFEYLEAARIRGEVFDVVILDPPAFAKSQRAKEQALKAYQNLNSLGIQVLKPGGILLTCSCSNILSMDELKEIVGATALRLHRPVNVLDTYTHGIDHPVHGSMPETAYLKAVIYRL